MKSLFALSPAIFFLWANPNLPQRSLPIAANIYASTGSRGADCRGTGICSIGTSNGQAPPPPGYKATVGYDSEGALFVAFKLSDLPLDVRSSQFDTDVFVMQSDCPVPAEVLLAIESKDSVLTLKTGYYPLHKTAETVKIIFN